MEQNTNETSYAVSSCHLVDESAIIPEFSMSFKGNGPLIYVSSYDPKHHFVEVFVNGEKVEDSSHATCFPLTPNTPDGKVKFQIGAITQYGQGIVTIRTLEEDTPTSRVSDFSSPHFFGDDTLLEGVGEGVGFKIVFDSESLKQGNPVSVSCLQMEGGGEEDKKAPTVKAVRKPGSSNLDSYGALDSGFDQWYPFSQIKEVRDDNGSVFIRIPKVYVCVRTFDKEISKASPAVKDGPVVGEVYISSRKVDDRFQLFPCFWSNDGKTPLDYIEVAKYLATERVMEDGSHHAYSLSGEPPYMEKPCLSAARELCNNNEDDFNDNYEYSPMDIWTLSLLQVLTLVELSTNNPKRVMRGYNISYNSKIRNNGSCDGLGEGGSGSMGYNTSGRSVMSYRGIENLWGNLETLIDGVYTTKDGTVYIDKHSSCSPNTFDTPSDSLSYKVPTKTQEVQYMGFDYLHPFTWLPINLDTGGQMNFQNAVERILIYPRDYSGYRTHPIWGRVDSKYYDLVASILERHGGPFIFHVIGTVTPDNSPQALPFHYMLLTEGSSPHSFEIIFTTQKSPQTEVFRCEIGGTWKVFGVIIFQQILTYYDNGRYGPYGDSYNSTPDFLIAMSAITGKDLRLEYEHAVQETPY